VLQRHSSAGALKYPTEFSAARQTAAAHPVQFRSSRIANSKMYISMSIELAIISNYQTISMSMAFESKFDTNVVAFAH
jgi:hypothetical protein